MAKGILGGVVRGIKKALIEEDPEARDYRNRKEDEYYIRQGRIAHQKAQKEIARRRRASKHASS